MSGTRTLQSYNIVNITLAMLFTNAVRTKNHNHGEEKSMTD